MNAAKIRADMHNSVHQKNAPKPCNTCRQTELFSLGFTPRIPRDVFLRTFTSILEIVSQPPLEPHRSVWQIHVSAQATFHDAAAESELPAALAERGELAATERSIFGGSGLPLLFNYNLVLGRTKALRIGLCCKLPRKMITPRHRGRLLSECLACKLVSRRKVPGGRNG